MKPTRSLPMYYDDITDAALEPYDHASDNEQDEIQVNGPGSENDDMNDSSTFALDSVQQKLTKVETSLNI